MEQPIDVEAVRADDDLIEALAAGLVPPPTCRPPGGDVEAELVALLAGWVADVRPETLLHRPDDTPRHLPLVAAAGPARLENGATPGTAFAEPVTTRLTVVGPATGVPTVAEPVDDAVTAAIPLRGRRRPRPRGLYRAAAAAAFIAVAASGTIAGSYDAKPGGALWPVTRIVFAEKARSVQAATDVSAGLARARKALGDGHTAEAKAAFQVVLAQLPAVSADEGQQVLLAQSTDLAGRLGVPAPGQPAATADTASAPPAPHYGRVLASGSVGAAIDTADEPVVPGPGSATADNPRTGSAAVAAPGGAAPAGDPAGPAPAGAAPAATAPDGATPPVGPDPSGPNPSGPNPSGAAPAAVGQDAGTLSPAPATSGSTSHGHPRNGTGGSGGTQSPVGTPPDVPAPTAVDPPPVTGGDTGHTTLPGGNAVPQDQGGDHASTPSGGAAGDGTPRSDTAVDAAGPATSADTPPPGDPAPGDGAPVDAAPVDTAPVDTAPIGTGPVDTAPVDTAPVATGPTPTAAADPASDEPVDAAPAPAEPAGDLEGSGSGAANVGSVGGSVTATVEIPTDGSGSSVLDALTGAMGGVLRLVARG